MLILLIKALSQTTDALPLYDVETLVVLGHDEDVPGLPAFRLHGLEIGRLGLHQSQRASDRAVSDFHLTFLGVRWPKEARPERRPCRSAQSPHKQPWSAEMDAKTRHLLADLRLPAVQKRKMGRNETLSVWHRDEYKKCCLAR
jgi:hypothetical protein